MAKATSKKTNDESDEVQYSGTGRELFEWEGDPKEAAEATGLAKPVPADEAKPGEPVIIEEPAEDVENPSQEENSNKE